MDRKSIGSFIAALRKAKGMTQKDLAMLLHVSDKTVSRWETGDGTPDLALIPVLAEIFGVTCDELLRGERRPESDAAETTPLGEKRKQWLMNRALTRLNVSIIITIGITLVGLILGELLSLLAHKPHVSGLTCICVSVIALIYQIAALVKAVSVTFETELDKAIAGFRKSAVIRAELAMALPAALIPVSAFDGLHFSYVVAVELVISFLFAAFLLGCAYAVLYLRDFFG